MYGFTPSPFSRVGGVQIMTFEGEFLRTHVGARDLRTRMQLRNLGCVQILFLLNSIIELTVCFWLLELRTECILYRFVALTEENINSLVINY